MKTMNGMFWAQALINPPTYIRVIGTMDSGTYPIHTREISPDHIGCVIRLVAGPIPTLVGIIKQAFLVGADGHPLWEHDLPEITAKGIGDNYTISFIITNPELQYNRSDPILRELGDISNLITPQWTPETNNND